VVAVGHPVQQRQAATIAKVVDDFVRPLHGASDHSCGQRIVGRHGALAEAAGAFLCCVESRRGKGFAC
jgi:hypothetical protein